ncbi:peptidoglycan-binding protein [Lysobacter sp. M15]|uniref:peptidoglycan-binding domain-containing protein n=1 Tax=Lysobacter sp. M15 TaxID=2916837 RepID=UPI001F569154|nr:peptidoglycan-binding protein [Lysobacter sp. M15]
MSMEDTNMANEIYEAMVQPRGPTYRDSQISRNSHYREPVDHSPSRLAGNSRIWGDASPEVQSRIIDALIEASRDAGLSTRETAHVLAIARAESGFNPDAAAGTTTAAGIGQFVDGTGRGYGLSNDNRFDAKANSRALVEHFIDNRNLAVNRSQGEEYIYKYHHDGPFSDYGGLQLARDKVMPDLDRYEQFVRQRLGLEQHAPGEVQQAPPKTPEAEEADPVRSRTESLLKLQSHGSEVWRLQTTLRGLGYTGADGRSLKTDGDFGDNTDHAVRAFQKAHGVEPVDGKVGNDTWATLTHAAQHPLVPEATHPNHKLYAAISEQLPAGTDPKAIANVTLQALENGITGPDRLQRMAVLGANVYLQGAIPGDRVKVDLTAPTPDLQAMSDHMARLADERTQEDHRRQQQSPQPQLSM